MADDNVPEEWRLVEDFPDYEVSNLGRIRRSRDEIRRHWQSGKAFVLFRSGQLRKTHIATNGYIKVALFRDGQKYEREVHPLVCAAFHGPKPSPFHEVAHWDNDRTNPRADNLRWATHQENEADKERHGSRVTGEQHPSVKITSVEVAEIRRLLMEGYTGVLLSKKFGLSKSQISRIKLGTRRAHG